MISDDVPPGHEIGDADKHFGSIYWKFLRGVALGKNSDLFLPATLGFIELVVYPVLLTLGQFLIIGAWLGIKTAGGFAGWKTSPTAFNRFLLLNLLNLIIAYFLLAPFVQNVPCPTPASVSTESHFVPEFSYTSERFDGAL